MVNVDLKLGQRAATGSVFVVGNMAWVTPHGHVSDKGWIQGVHLLLCNHFGGTLSCNSGSKPTAVPKLESTTAIHSVAATLSANTAC